jgi:UDP-N-acetylmuramyl pentapeptide synthase
MRSRIRDPPAMLRTPAVRMHVRQASLTAAGRCCRGWRGCTGRRWSATRVIAVVGSFGKSTTTRAIAAALGVPEHGWMLSNSWSWIAFALMRIRPGQRHAVIEVGISKPGLMKGYARTVGPDIAVVTSIGSEHHVSLGTLEVTRAEKSWMLQVLPASGAAVLNGDDPNVMWMKEETRARVVTFGFGAAGDVRAGEVGLDWPRGTRFHLTAFGEERDVRPVARSPYDLPDPRRGRGLAPRRLRAGWHAGAAARPSADASRMDPCCCPMA